jgi:hypothetical protein
MNKGLVPGPEPETLCPCLIYILSVEKFIELKISFYDSSNLDSYLCVIYYDFYFSLLKTSSRLRGISGTEIEKFQSLSKMEKGKSPVAAYT